MKQITGGVCAPKGFLAAGIHCGIRKNKQKKDLALIYSQIPASAAAIYTQNLVQGAPIAVTKANLQNGKAQAMLCNSGNANTCNADGLYIAEQMCFSAASHLGISPEDVIIASTGVIGQPLPLKPITENMGPLAASLSATGSDSAAQAIMTTDTLKKEIAFSFALGGKTCVIGGIAKGSGMIHPNMATMLVFLTSDAAISPAMLQKALKEDADDTFNMLSVDGDTSTNDMVSILANGLAGNPVISEEDDDFNSFKQALNQVTSTLCKAIAQDGEGATKALACNVSEAASKEIAKAVAKSVICSNLVKTAMYGADANWGRVLCAVGYAGQPLDIQQVDVSFSSSAGEIPVCVNGAGIPFSEELAKQILLDNEIHINIQLKSGSASATAWGCDLTEEYVHINGDYRS